jgi:hypothetical protein
MAVDEVVSKLHGFYAPLIFRAVDIASSPVSGHVQRLREKGFRSPFSGRLDRALTQFADRFTEEALKPLAEKSGRPAGEVAQEVHILPELRKHILAVRDIAVALSELEVSHFPVWWAWAVEDLKSQGLV